MNRTAVIAQFLTFFGILLVVSFLSQYVYARLDFTSDKRYTLGEATKEILKSLDKVVTVKVYFSDKLPPNLLKNKRDFEDQLKEYEKVSSGNVVYEFINPNKSEVAEREAQREGINPLIVNVRERDKVEQIRAYMGAVLYFKEEKEILPYIKPGEGMEYMLTTGIKKLTVANKPKLAFIQGHGEPEPEACRELSSQLSILYQVEPVSFGGETVPSLSAYKAALLIRPKDSIPSEDFTAFEEYLKNGGNMLVAYSNLEGDMQTAELKAAKDIGLVGWLSKIGIAMGQNFLVDESCASVTVTQQQGFFRFNTQVRFPYFPIINSFPKHPVVGGLESVFLPFASTLNFVKPIEEGDTTQVTNLLLTSNLTGSIAPPGYMDVNKKWQKSDYTIGPQPVALGIAGALFGGETPSRLVVVSNSDFIINGQERQQQRDLNPDNVNFASNAVDWIADDTGLIDLRTKGVTSRPIKELEETETLLVKYGNFLAPILIVLVYGFIRRQAKQRRRQHWLEESYSQV